MRAIYKLILILGISIFILVFNSCKQTAQSSFEDWLEENYKESTYIELIKERFSDSEEFDICYDQFEYFDTLRHFYKEKKYKPIWTNNLIFNNKIDTILSFFSNAEIHGLDSNLFDASLIRYYRNLLIQKAKYDSTLDYRGLATLELLISNSLLSYTKAMCCGIINPKTIFSKNHYLPVNEIDSGTLFLPLKVLDLGVI